jgi:hypothetical protein
MDEKNKNKKNKPRRKKNGDNGKNGAKKTAAKPVKVESVVVGVRIVAAVYGVSVRAVQQWVNENGMPKCAGRDQYDLSAIRAWREKRIRDELSKDAKVAERAAEADAVWREEKAKVAKMDRLVREGELLSRIEVDRLGVEKCIAVKTALMALPITLAKALEGVSDDKIEKVIFDEVNLVLGRFADNSELASAAGVVGELLAGEIIGVLKDKKLVARKKLDAVRLEIERVAVECMK